MKRSFAVLVIGLSTYPVCDSGYAASPSAFPVPSAFFGMHITCNGWNGTTCGPFNWPTVPIGSLGKPSCTGWHFIQQSRGTYNWSTLDQYVNLAQQKNVDLIYTFYGVPSWAVSTPNACVPSSCSPSIQDCEGAPPARMQDFANFVTALVTRYQGKIKFYELWNEPYDSYGNGLVISPSAMAAMTTNAYNIIRSIDPGAQIISPSMSTTTLASIQYASDYFAAGGPTGVDIASIHAYPSGVSAVSDAPEAITPNRYLLWYLLPALTQYLPDKPLWDTEGSWGGLGGQITNPSQEAAFIARWYILHWSSGFARTYWYEWDNPEVGTLMPSMLGSSTPATAFQQVQNWLIGRTMTTQCRPGADSITWTCGLAGPNGYQAIIVWNTSGTGSFAPPAWPDPLAPSGLLNYTQYRDLAGNIHPYSGGVVSTGIQPILLEN